MRSLTLQIAVGNGCYGGGNVINADGEIVKRTPVVRVLPKAIEVFVPLESWPRPLKEEFLL